MSNAETARSVALDVLVAVEKDDAYANILLPQRIDAAKLDSRDAQLATELCHGTLRWRGFYDAIITSVSSRPLEEMHVVVRNVLRLGTHQLLNMRVTTHAAVNESVELIKSSKMLSATGFINAILRKISQRDREQWIALFDNEESGTVDRLEKVYSHPAWIVRALGQALVADGRTDELEALLSADNNPGPLCLIDLRDAKQPLPETESVAYSPLGFQIQGGGNPAALIKAHGGELRVQDQGSQLAALALVHSQNVEHGEQWLDMCAAPGGKSAVFASALSAAEGTVTANELNPARISLLKKSLAPWSNVVVTQRDGVDFSDEPQQFNRILVDAPCSGLGALRRRPESRWRKSPRDIAELTAIQARLVEAAYVALKPGGVLAYVTCSPHVAETRGIVNQLLKRHPDLTELDAHTVLDRFVTHPVPSTRGQLSVQLWPHIHGTDAMFISLMSKATS